MVNPLRVIAPPEELASRGQVIELTGKVADFPRLVEIIETDLGDSSTAAATRKWRALPVEIKLGFGWADDRREIPAMSGSIRARMAGICQRCLEPFEFPLQAELDLLLLKVHDELTESGSADVWEVDEGAVRPLDIVEEALVMALPLAPMHETAEICGSFCGALSDDDTGGSADVDRPFANLRAQMEESN